MAEYIQKLVNLWEEKAHINLLPQGLNRKLAFSSCPFFAWKHSILELFFGRSLAPTNSVSTNHNSTPFDTFLFSSLLSLPFLCLFFLFLGNIPFICSIVYRCSYSPLRAAQNQKELPFTCSTNPFVAPCFCFAFKVNALKQVKHRFLAPHHFNSLKHLCFLYTFHGFYFFFYSPSGVCFLRSKSSNLLHSCVFCLELYCGY